MSNFFLFSTFITDAETVAATAHSDMSRNNNFIQNNVLTGLSVSYFSIMSTLILNLNRDL